MKTNPKITTNQKILPFFVADGIVLHRDDHSCSFHLPLIIEITVVMASQESQESFESQDENRRSSDEESCQNSDKENLRPRYDHENRRPCHESVTSYDRESLHARKDDSEAEMPCSSDESSQEYDRTKHRAHKNTNDFADPPRLPEQVNLVPLHDLAKTPNGARRE